MSKYQSQIMLEGINAMYATQEYETRKEKLWNDIPIAVAVPVVEQHKWWHGIGRYLLLILACMAAFHIKDNLKHIKEAEAKIYYEAHHAWYINALTDEQFKAVKKQLWFF